MRDGVWMIACALGAAMTLAAGCGAPSRLFRGDEVARGQRLFTRHGCNGCHTVGVVGTPLGPDLTGIGQRHSRAYFERWLRDPAAQKPTAHMPRLALPSGDIGPLAAYLASLR
jgi:mono/diheme cytochrome c family protein